jgi:acylphosphatase
MSRERLWVLYVGRVQGVGFRATASYLAPAFGVSGFVRNLPDGSVELEAQGDPGRIREFLDAIRGELGAKIHRADESPLPVLPDEASPSFQVR